MATDVRTPAPANRKTFWDCATMDPLDPGLQITVSDTQPSWTSTGTLGTDYNRCDWQGQGTYFTVLGGNPFTANPNSTACGQMLVNGNGQPDAAEIEFLMPGQRVCFHAVLFENDGGDFRIFVDEVPTTRKPFPLPVTANWFFDIYNATNQVKKIRISIGRCNFGFLYWSTPTVLPIRATLPNQKRKVGVCGDSYTGGNYVADGTANIFEGCWHHQLVARGFERIPFGQGGTGYINNGSGNTTFTDSDYSAGGSTYSAFGASRRMAQYKAMYAKGMRDFIIFGGGNDAAASNAAVLAAAQKFYSDLNFHCPGMNVYVVGAQAAPFNASAVNDQLGIAARQAPNVKAFIDMRGGAPWITGTGKINGKTGNGNADYFITTDGVHPTREGHEWIGNLVWDAIQNVPVAA